MQYFVKWKGYPENDNTWESLQDIPTPDLLKKYHQRYPLEHKKGAQQKGKVSSRLRLTALCRTHPTSLLPVSPTSFPFPLRHTTTPPRLPPNSPLICLAQPSAHPRPPTSIT